MTRVLAASLEDREKPPADLKVDCRGIPVGEATI